METLSTACGLENTSRMRVSLIETPLPILAELDEKIADAESANEKKALRDKKALLTARHEAKSETAIAAEDAGRIVTGLLVW